MSGHHPFRELTKDWSPERQAHVAEKVRLFKHELAVAALRKARQQSQDDLAVCLEVPAPTLATLEHQTDLYVSTLRRRVEALGGTLEIVAHFPDGSVPITTFSALATVEAPQDVD